MKYLVSAVLILVTAIAGAEVAAPVEKSPEVSTKYQYAQLTVTAIKGSRRSDDDFRWAYPDKAGKVQTVFKVDRDAIAEHFEVSSDSGTTVAILNKIGAMGWKLVDVTRVESHRENGIDLPFYTHYHFIR